MNGPLIVLTALVYLTALFAVAHFGDRRAAARREAGRPTVYALSLAVYCTSWTFFGSVGVAAGEGLAFLGIYLGPVLVFLFAPGLVWRIIRLARAERITTIADFVGARYGKSNAVAALAALIALVGIVPYIALQLKAISTSVAAIVSHYGGGDLPVPPLLGDVALLVALVLGLFAILFGTRHADATEHQDGLVLAIAAESVVKLAAFLAVGLWAVFGLFSPGALLEAARAAPRAAGALSFEPDGRFLAAVFLGGFAILLLPRQFHMTVVENRTRGELARARWLFPLYLVLINLLVLPIALAGLVRLDGAVDPDLYVLALPLSEGADLLSLLAFVGGLSAATAMVIVASIALAIMVSNDLVLPLILKRGRAAAFAGGDAAGALLGIRRAAILGVVLLGYAYYRAAGAGSGLASIGLLSFAAVAQFAPSVFIGLAWKGANGRGAKAGLLSGTLLWGYTLLAPTLAPGAAFVTAGPFGLAFLRPEALLGLDLDPLVHGTLVSLGVNTAMLVLGSLSRAATPRERIQASIFVRADGAPRPMALRRSRGTVTVGALKGTVARYLGAERTERAFSAFAAREGRPLGDVAATADGATLGFAEQLLGAAIGSASSRLVLSLLIERRQGGGTAARLLDDASQALQHNRDVLSTALDQGDRGLGVFDADLRLTFWNRQLRDLLDLPAALGTVGTPLSEILDALAASGEVSATEARAAFDALARPPARRQLALARSERIVEFGSHPMPEGGLVVSVTDMTERVRRASALRDLAETLEERVAQRTAELSAANAALAEARRAAEEAALGKTRFLAAAGHDILQPLNAARLYLSALLERDPSATLATEASASLDAAEAIIGAVLDLSRLDAGAVPPTIETVALAHVFAQLRRQMGPLAAEKGVRLAVRPTPLAVASDRALLARLLANLVSNAVKYAPHGRVLVAARRRAGHVAIEVHDTGIGIPEHQLRRIFEEFVRLDEGTRAAAGLGLGLSIVDRIARLLGHDLALASRPGRGTRFRLTLPAAALGAGKPASLPLQPPPPAGGRLAGLLVLVIDNDPAIRAGMTALLTGWGCRVLASAGPHDLPPEAPAADLVLVDYHLDGATGLDALALLRARRPALPAILVTADRSPALREAAAAEGIAILPKPVKPAQLRAAMTAAVPRREAAE